MTKYTDKLFQNLKTYFREDLVIQVLDSVNAIKVLGTQNLIKKLEFVYQIQVASNYFMTVSV